MSDSSEDMEMYSDFFDEEEIDMELLEKRVKNLEEIVKALYAELSHLIIYSKAAEKLDKRIDDI